MDMTLPPRPATTTGHGPFIHLWLAPLWRRYFGIVPVRGSGTKWFFIDRP
jgi:hypothetical protein